MTDLSKATFEELVAEQLRRIGENPDREGLKKTPERVAKSQDFLTGGYRIDPMALLNKAIFTEKHESMVLVRDIEIYSLCEHHMLPFFGKAHIAYIPDGRIVGLSKLARLVDVYARRLQVQERLTDEVADAMQCTLKPLGVGIVIECYHLCMMMRGVQKQNSRTVTSAVRGVFRDDQKTRDEFLGLVVGGSGNR